MTLFKSHITILLFTASCFKNYIKLHAVILLYLLQLIAFKSRHPPESDEEVTSYTNLILDVQSNIKWLKTEGPGLQRWLQVRQLAGLVDHVVKGAAYAMPVPSVENRRESYRSLVNHF